MKKIVIMAAIAAFATAACSKQNETVTVPADETAAATTDIQLNADGSVNTDAATTAAPTEAAK